MDKLNLFYNLEEHLKIGTLTENLSEENAANVSLTGNNELKAIMNDLLSDEDEFEVFKVNKKSAPKSSVIKNNPKNNIENEPKNGIKKDLASSVKEMSSSDDDEILVEPETVNTNSEPIKIVEFPANRRITRSTTTNAKRNENFDAAAAAAATLNPEFLSILTEISSMENNSDKTNSNKNGVARNANKRNTNAVETSIAATIANIISNAMQNNQTHGRGSGRGRGRERGRGRRPGCGRQTNNEASIDTIEINDDYLPNTSAANERLLRRQYGAYRQFVAEKAARSTVIDSIDLVTSPLLPVEGFINLDSEDEEEKASANTATTTKLNFDFDEENPEISVKIDWNGKVECFPLRKYQKFGDIFKLLAERENADVKSVYLNLNDKLINIDDTPASIDYKIYEFIDGRIIRNNLILTTKVSTKHDPNLLSVKIQSALMKRPIKVKIGKSEPFKILYIKCSEELKVSCEQLKLSFDGELLEVNATPTDMDFEGGELIDVFLK